MRDSRENMNYVENGDGSDGESHGHLSTPKLTTGSPSEHGSLEACTVRTRLTRLPEDQL